MATDLLYSGRLDDVKLSESSDEMSYGIVKIRDKEEGVQMIILETFDATLVLRESQRLHIKCVSPK